MSNIQNLFTCPTIVQFFKKNGIKIYNKSGDCQTVKKTHDVFQSSLKADGVIVVMGTQNKVKKQAGYRKYLKRFNIPFYEIFPNYPMTTFCYKQNFITIPYDQKIEDNSITSEMKTLEQVFKYYERVFFNEEKECCICYKSIKEINKKSNKACCCAGCCAIICDDCVPKYKSTKCPCCRREIEQLTWKKKQKEEDTTNRIYIENEAVAEMVFEFLTSQFPQYNVTRN
jgi:hypothetical protein